MSKDKLSLTLSLDLIEAIDKEMTRHNQNNRSKFIEFTLREIFFSPSEKLALLKKQREYSLSKFKVMNDDILKLEDYIEATRQAEEKLNRSEKDEMFS